MHASFRSVIALFTCVLGALARAVEPCAIKVVEKGTAWPVPLVELRTVNQMVFVSDNAGRIAFDVPELMGRETWFTVASPGYEMPPDGFGLRGARLTPQPGKTLRVEIERRSIARRLGRITGTGIFGESQKLGLERDWADSATLGCDSIQLTTHAGRLFWAWGDTAVARYPLGVFHMSGATTALRPVEKFEPPLRLRFQHFLGKNGEPRGLAPMPGEGPTWLSGLISLPDATGAHRLVAHYIKVRGHLTAYESGLCVWDDAGQEFKKLRTLWTHTDQAPKQPPAPEGHVNHWTDPEGKTWLLFGNPLPVLRCPATFEAWQDEKTWQPLTPQPALKTTVGPDVKPHSGSIAWNPWRQRWLTVFMAQGKPGKLGEIYYAEAASPLGPWGTAVKILSHDNYTFYNPRIHAELTGPESPVLIFEGTYTREFSDRAAPTPRWDYNQILYRLDLDTPALHPAR